MTPDQHSDRSTDRSGQVSKVAADSWGCVPKGHPPVSTRRNTYLPDNFEDLSASFIAYIRALPTWHRDALCLEYPNVDWFPNPGESAAPAKAVCARCLVQATCLSWALDHDEVGVWGGTSADERRAIKRQRRKLA